MKFLIYNDTIINMSEFYFIKAKPIDSLSIDPGFALMIEGPHVSETLNFPDVESRNDALNKIGLALKNPEWQVCVVSTKKGSST